MVADGSRGATGPGGWDEGTRWISAVIAMTVGRWKMERCPTATLPLPLSMQSLQAELH